MTSSKLAPPPLLPSTPAHSTHDTTFPRAEGEPPGKGRWIFRYEKGRPAATLTCPLCSAYVAIPNGAISDRTGAVDGAVSCSATSCRWFDYVTLAGWLDAVGGR